MNTGNRIICLAVPLLLAHGAAAQSLDKLSLVGGSTLLGSIVPFTCSKTAANQHVSFQPTAGLPQQAPGLKDIASIQVGNLELDSSNTTAGPDPQDIATLRGYLLTKSRPDAASIKTLSLGLTVAAICSPPLPASKFTGKLSVDGTGSFAATVQRLISGTLYAKVDPASENPGSITPLLEMSTAYGDSTKGSVTTKSSQIDTGRFTLGVLIHHADSAGTYGSTYINVIADEYHSFSQGVSLQQGYGVGVSQILAGTLTVEGDIWDVREAYYPPTAAFSSAAVRFRKSDTLYSGGRFVLSEDAEAVLPFHSLRALLIRGGASLAIKLGSTTTPQPFSLTFAYGDDYFRSAPKGYKQNYAKITLGIAYNW